MNLPMHLSIIHSVIYISAPFSGSKHSFKGYTYSNTDHTQDKENKLIAVTIGTKVSNE